ncbi:Enterobactin exporter EntS [Usitatibacter rugosus]|uniref:Enterobactin exporter EntS n=1 Tax=Usitatibacter rugosus TaxID=2732067 RepID=A0A6M4GR57_9PROT|nr:MFS transporter [Usitatibacter rugosus]QJR09268.1 Enterobactin exporter EntS [Usitatibacter rugosus]
MSAASAEGFSPSFRHFVVARLFGGAAQQMMLVALGWQIYALTASAWDLGLVGLMQFVPAFLLTLPAGHLVDRVDRRKVMGAAMLVQFAVSFVLAWASVGGWVSRDLILGLSIAIGVSRALQMPSQQALMPSLVPLGQLARGTAVASGAAKFAVIGGPALGGFIYVAGAEVVYGVAAAFLLAATVFVGMIHRPDMQMSREPVSIRSLLAGFTFLWQHKVVLGAISLDLFAVLLGSVTALMPMFAKDVLDTGPWGLGLLRSSPAIGALVVAIWLARNPLDGRVGKKMFIAVAIYGVTMLVFGYSTTFWLSMLALVISGGADMVSVVIRLTLVQIETPDDMRGRVSAVNSTFIGASNELGDFRAGATAEWLGAVGSVLVGGIGTLLVAALWVKIFPTLASRDQLMP